MNRRELLLRLVLNEISDDYENVDQCILRHVAEIGGKCGLTIVRSDIVDALAELIDGGFAKAYILSGREPFSTELQGIPALDVAEEDFKTYFYITKKGIDLQFFEKRRWPGDCADKQH